MELLFDIVLFIFFELTLLYVSIYFDEEDGGMYAKDLGYIFGYGL